jgi:hypothetical protein
MPAATPTALGKRKRPEGINKDNGEGTSATAAGHMTLLRPEDDFTATLVANAKVYDAGLVFAVPLLKELALGKLLARIGVDGGAPPDSIGHVICLVVLQRRRMLDAVRALMAKQKLAPTVDGAAGLTDAAGWADPLHATMLGLALDRASCLYKKHVFARIKVRDADFAVAFLHAFLTRIGSCILAGPSSSSPIPCDSADARALARAGLDRLSMLEAGTTRAQAECDGGPPMMAFVRAGLGILADLEEASFTNAAAQHPLTNFAARVAGALGNSGVGWRRGP